LLCAALLARKWRGWR